MTLNIKCYTCNTLADKNFNSKYTNRFENIHYCECKNVYIKYKSSPHTLNDKGEYIFKPVYLNQYFIYDSHLYSSQYDFISKHLILVNESVLEVIYTQDNEEEYNFNKCINYLKTNILA